MNKQLSHSEIVAMKRTLQAAFVCYCVLVIVVFCFTLWHPPANSCPAPMSMSWLQPDCKLSR